jgi:hypothetical protein
MPCRLLLASVSSIGAIVFAPTALAWGPEGHAIVADIAEAHLTPAAMTQVKQLLGQEGHAHLDDISSWADEVRSQRPETAPWHFVDIPLDANSYDPARDCKNDDCVIARIVRFEKILADTSTAPKDRLEALKWVVHFVGDIHQPLHDEDNNDRGGNDIHVSYFKKSTNLHAVWDGKIIEHALNLSLGPNYSFDHDAVKADALVLDGQIAAAERAAWAPTNLTADLTHAVIGWANESHALAQKVAYPDLPAQRRGDWSDTYQQEAWPVVQGQLEHGGVRLASTHPVKTAGVLASRGENQSV